MSTTGPSPIPSSSKSISPSPEAAEVEAAGGGKWQPEEDARLKQAVADLGDKGGKEGVWREISRRVGGGRTDKSCKKRWTHSLDPSLRKGRWTAEEDAILLEHYAQVGSRWHEIAEFIPGRKADQVAKRYRDTLDPALTAAAPWTAEEDAVILAAYQQVGPLWTLICAKVGPGRSGMHVRNRWRTLTRAATPGIFRRTSEGRPASRERLSETGPSRRARSVTSAGIDGRTRSPAERAEAWRDLSRSESPASLAEASREGLPSPPIAENAATSFDFDKYYAAFASPAPHLPSILGEAIGSSLGTPSAPFSDHELAILRAYPPPPQESYDNSMDWARFDGAATPISAPPTFPSPLSQAPITHGLVVCTHCHGSGFVPSSTDLLGLGGPAPSLGEAARGAGWPGSNHL